MSWYDNVFLAPPEDEPEEVMEDGVYEFYHFDEDLMVSVEDGWFTSIMHYEEDGETQTDCSDKFDAAELELLVEKILEINKNENARH